MRVPLTYINGCGAVSFPLLPPPPASFASVGAFAHPSFFTHSGHAHSYELLFRSSFEITHFSGRQPLSLFMADEVAEATAEQV
jgi:hypothetical protein